MLRAAAPTRTFQLLTREQGNMRFPIIHVPVLVCAVTAACSAESPYGGPGEPKAETTATTTAKLQTFPPWGMICQESNPMGLPCMRYMGNHNQIMGIDAGGNLDQMFQYDGQHIRTWDGHCLDDFAFGLTGSSINAWECNGKANQNWTQDGSSFQGSFFNGRFHGWGGECLENVHRTGIDLALNGAQGSFQMQPCDTGQAWQFFNAPVLYANGGFTVPVTLTFGTPPVATPSADTYPGLQAYYPANIDLTLDVQWNGRANGTTVWLWTHNGGSAQQWNYDFSTQTISLADGSNMCLDKPAGQNANGTLVQLWQCTGAANQQWQMVGNTPGYQLVNVESGRCLDASFGNFNAGAPVGTWDCWGGLNQQWRLFYPFPPGETLR
jgi:Ricin-type beta-trefoil lectin domain